MTEEMGVTDARGEERREYERHLCNLKMTYTVLSSTDATPFEYGVAHTKDLSESGVCVFTENEIQAPVLMQLNINLPVRPYHVLLLGKALRCERCEDDSLYETGLKFVGILPPEFRRLVQQVVSGEEDTPGE